MNFRKWEVILLPIFLFTFCVGINNSQCAIQKRSSLNHSTKLANFVKNTSKFFSSGGTIVVEGIVLKTNTGSTEISTTHISIYDANQMLVYDESGCWSSSCTVDLSFLNNGTYSVYVSTSDEGMFSGDIVLD